MGSLNYPKSIAREPKPKTNQNLKPFNHIGEETVSCGEAKPFSTSYTRRIRPDDVGGQHQHGKGLGHNS